MNLKSLVYFSLFGFAGLNVNAQNASDELLKINNVPFTVGEFERIYTKNLDLIKDNEQKDIDNYLDLFVLYKLKVSQAYDLGLDKKDSYINEFATHRSQLAEQYLTNQETLEKLAKEAYERSKYEINASHIIFLADELSSPADTLKAYNKAIAVRNEILLGKDFEQAAVDYSEDPSAKTNKGNLGYFSVLRMVYPFETGAYNTPVGEISMPIRSQFGYHLIKVNDKRLTKGKRTVAHIFIDGKDDIVYDTSKKRIDEVYKLLQDGTPFEELVERYSEDPSTKSNKGIFRNYETGSIDAQYLDTEVYKLNTPESYSKPFKSQHGWHIVKLISEDPIPTYDDRKSFYLRKVQSDGRSRIINDELVAHLKQKYNYKEDAKNLSNFTKEIEKNITNQEFFKDIKSNKALATFSNQKITEQEFADFAINKGVNFSVGSSVQSTVKYVFNDFVSQQILKYYNDNLENEFPDFKYTVQEFKEGLLLFDLLEVEVWQKAKNDTLGYTNFYQAHLNDFKQNEAIQGVVYKSEKKADLKNAQKQLKKAFGKTPTEINTKEITVVKKGKFEKEDKSLPKNYILKEGVSEIFEQDGMFYLVVADEYFPNKIQNLEEAKQDVIYQYQQNLEEKWIKDLKNNAEIKINDPILLQLKKKYKK